MALDNIVFDDGDGQNIVISDMDRGNIGVVQRIVTESDTGNGPMMLNIPIVTGGGVGEIAYVF